MLHGGSAFALAFVAGLFSVLSPCVLPILPVAVGSAVSTHRLGPLALATGLALSFTTIGLFVAAIGFSIGLSQQAFQTPAAVLLVAMGLLLLIPSLRTRVTAATAPMTSWLNDRLGRHAGRGLFGQFGLGLLFGAVWSPCAGPTLGAAALLAATGKNLPAASLTMMLFAIGSVLPILAIGAVSGSTIARLRTRVSAGSRRGSRALGGVLVVAGLLMVSGLDRSVESVLTQHSPDWLVRITSQY